MITPWGGLVVSVAETASTMDDAQRLEDEGAPDGSLVRADHQTQGRGRHAGRRWESLPGNDLLFTIFWHPHRFRRSEFAPSLTVGLGLCLWAESQGLTGVALKWPNDLYLNHKKAAGILVRQRWSASGAGSVHAGVGVNLVPRSGAFRTEATSMADAGVRIAPMDALNSLLPHLAAALDHGDPRAACEARLWHRGERFLVDREGAFVSGVALGLDERGHLLWEGPQGLEALTSEEPAP